MLKENLTFNDLPKMVGRLCEKIESLENALKESLAKEPSAKENLHVLGISKSSFYYKAKHGGIPVIKQGKHLFVYRDELDKWLETGRKKQVPLSFEEEHEQMLAATRHKAKSREL